jgi:hypothetical protein
LLSTVLEATFVSLVLAVTAEPGGVISTALDGGSVGVGVGVDDGGVVGVEVGVGVAAGGVVGVAVGPVIALPQISNSVMLLNVPTFDMWPM